jgi:predicted phage terminase large subunit-like protein
LVAARDTSHGAILEKMSKNMLLMGRICLPNMFSVKSPKFHEELVSDFHDPLVKKINIIAPRGHAKSSLVACLWVLYHIFFDPGHKVVVLVSKTEGHAIRLLQTIKNALDYSIPLRQVFGYWGEHSARTWKTNEVILKDGTAILCRGTGQMVVGLKYGDQRPTLVVLDDPEDMMNTKTAEAMEMNLRWLLQSLLPTLDPLRGRICIVGTPQHERCMVEIVSTMEGWKTRRYKAIQDDGTALWPEWWSVEALLKEKASLESINRVSSFYREYQCQVIGDEDQLFKESYLQTYAGELDEADGEVTLNITSLNGLLLDIPKRVPVNIFMGIDPASSTEQTADYSAIMAIAIDDHMNRYILPYVRKHLTPMGVAAEILRMYRYFKPKRTRIESVGYQEMLRDYLRQNEYIPGLEIKENPRTMKSKRLEQLEPMFFQGKVFLLENMQELRDELLLYPRGKHDDLLDALYYANKNVYKPYHAASGTSKNKSVENRLKTRSWMAA